MFAVWAPRLGSGGGSLAGGGVVGVAGAAGAGLELPLPPPPQLVRKTTVKARQMQRRTDFAHFYYTKRSHCTYEPTET